MRILPFLAKIISQPTFMRSSHKELSKNDASRCTRGYLHFVCVVTYKEKGKTKAVYVDKKRQAQALFWSRNYKLFKKLLKEQTAGMRKACFLKTVLKDKSFSSSEEEKM
jgi:hypothetical protein